MYSLWSRSLQNPNTGRKIMLVIILLASALRFFRLDAQSMWFDEAARLLIARTDVASILRQLGGDTLPPLHHLITHFWRLTGEQDFWLRLPSAFFGLLLIPVVFSLGKHLFGTKTGLFSALIIAIMPYQVSHSQQSNLYSLLVLLSALQILFFWKAVQNGRHLWLALFAFFAVVGIYVHYFSGLLTLSLNIWLILTGLTQDGRHYRQRWSPLLITDAVIVLLALPVMAFVLRSAGDVINDFWLERPNIGAPLATFFLFTLSASLPGSWAAAGFVLTSMLFAVVLLDLAYEYRRETSKRPALQILLILTFLPIILTLAVSQAIPLYLSRTLIITLPTYALLLGRALATTRARSPAPYLAGGVLLILIVSLYGYYFVGEFSKPDYRSAAAYVSDRIEPGQVLVHSTNRSYVPFLFYFGLEEHYLLEGDPAPYYPPRIHEIAGGQTLRRDELTEWSSVWLVAALGNSIPYRQDLLAQFDEAYPILEDEIIDGMVVRHYDLTVESP